MGHDAEYPYIYKDNADIYFNALAVYIQEFYGTIKVKMYVAGGSAIILRHNFRNSTEDIDAYIESLNNIDISFAIHQVAVDYGITEDWINSDFTQSPSASPNLLFGANFYKTFGNGILDVYTISDIDLICMKLVSFRDKDIPDIVNLINENRGMLTEQLLIDRITFLYGSFDIIGYNARQLVSSMKLPQI